MQSKLNKYLLEKKENYKKVSLQDFNSNNDFLDNVALLLNSKADVIELETKGIDASSIIKAGKRIRELTAVFGALFIISDRIDIAKILDADGVILDKTGMSIADAQKLIEGGMLLGYFVSRNEDIKQLKDNDLDFIVVREKTNTIEIKTFICKDLD